MKSASVVALRHPDEPDLFLYLLQKDTSLWTLPGGGADPGETELETAERELKEEAGLKAESGLKKVFNKVMKDNDGEEIDVTLFIGNYDNNQKIDTTKDPSEESLTFKFLDPTTTKNLRFSKSKCILCVYLNRLSQNKLLKNEGMVYIATDGDGIGAGVERAASNDNLHEIRRYNNLIINGQALIREWAKKRNGEVYIDGGDDLSFVLPEQYLGEIEEMRRKYHKVTLHTLTVGIGRSMSQAMHAMIYGKLKGKNRTVIWSVDKEKEFKELNRPKSDISKLKEEGLIP